ncbi:MAG: hypothetical protein ACI9KE_004998 [Polyangiales bacterium]|jgi:hypothetical protein
MTRISDIVYVVARLKSAERTYFLLHAHAKWGDWSLVGGHVESHERDDWDAAARRETNEEMTPLVVGRDMSVEPLIRETIEWGPEPSRSAGGEPTVYRSRWYSLRFLRDPMDCLAQLAGDDFLLIEEERLEAGTDTDITGLFRRLSEGRSSGLRDLPFAWPEVLDLETLPLERRECEVRPSIRMMG